MILVIMIIIIKKVIVIIMIMVTSFFGETLYASFTASGQVWTPSTIIPNLFQGAFKYVSSVSKYFQMFKMACCGDDNNLEDDDGDADNDDEANNEDDDQSLSSLKRSPSKPGSR